MSGSDNNYKEKLKQFVETLDEKIKYEEETLAFLKSFGQGDGGMYEVFGVGEPSSFAQTAEPTLRALNAYKRAKENLYQLFPELKEE